MITPASLPANRRANSGTGRVPGSTVSTSSCRTSGAPTAAEEPLTDSYPACVAQEPEDYGRRVVQQISGWKGGGEVQPEILRPLKMFLQPEVPGPGFVG